MLPFIVARLVQSVPLIISASIIIFLIMRFIPGDPALIYAGPLAPPESIEVVREKFGLKESLPEQYFIWASNAIQGDFGTSYLSGIPVATLLWDRIPATLELAVAAILITIIAGVTTGALAATNNGKMIDTVITSATGLIVAIPGFWLGILAIYLFAVTLGWLPPGGRVSLFSDPIEGLKHILMPALILASNPFAVVSRLVKGSMLEVLHEDYVRTAISKGLSSGDVLRRHVLRNAMVPVLTVLSLQFGRLLGGAVITESIFVWPGIGRLLLTALQGRDYAIVQATLLILVISFTIINLITDILYGYLDPRIRVGKSTST
jgi:peptide/nickel transport system permease protein